MGRPKNIANLYDPPKSRTQFSEGHKSKGILDDYAVRGNIDTKEGKIEHTPTLDNHIANKKYVDDNDFWDRTGAVLSPKTAGDDVETSGFFKVKKVGETIDLRMETDPIIPQLAVYINDVETGKIIFSNEDITLDTETVTITGSLTTPEVVLDGDGSNGWTMTPQTASTSWTIKGYEGAVLRDVVMWDTLGFLATPKSMRIGTAEEVMVLMAGGTTAAGATLRARLVASDSTRKFTVNASPLIFQAASINKLTLTITEATFDTDVVVNGDITTDGLNFTSATELTISSGAVTVTKGHHSIDTEADATNDDLDTINGGDAGEILLLLPKDSARTVRIRNGIGNIFLKHQTDSSPFSFSSPAGAGAATRYAGGGWYDFSSTDANLNQANITQTFGTANVSYAAHASLIAGGAGDSQGGSGAVTIVVSGTSIDDEGNRTTSDSEVIVPEINDMGSDEYFETTKKWIGQITYTLTVGATGHTTYTADFNYGFSKYEDFANQSFTITGIQVAGEAGASDSNFNIILFHHSPIGWIYFPTGFVPGGTQLANMNTDHSTEQDLSNGEPFAWKRTDLNTNIAGNNGEGVVVRIDTSSAKAVESLSGIIWVHTAPAFAYMSDTKQHLIFMKHGSNWLEL